MYEFHYKYIKKKYGENATLAYTDTDSLIYSIKTLDYYADIRGDLKKRFDTSDLPDQNIFHFPLINKKALGLFKDECLEDIMIEFIGIRAKCYCYMV